VILVIVKYLGLCLAAVSSVWGTTRELTVQSPDGKKRLTSPGVVAVVLTIVGLAISILFEDLQRRQTAIEQSQNLAAEAQRTNRIIISAQPLTSLTFSLRLASSDGALRQTMLDGAEKISENSYTSQAGSLEVPSETMEYRANLIPLLKYLASLAPHLTQDPDHVNHNSDKTRLMVAIIQLDEAENTVLSFGEIDPAVEWWGESDDSAKLSAGFAPVNGNTRPGRSSPSVGFQGDKPNVSYELSWALDPITLKNSIDRVVEEIHPTAKLPRIIKIALLHDGTVLPFQKNNFAMPSIEDFWSETGADVTKIEKPVPPIELTMTLNGFSEIAFKYKLEEVYGVDLADEYDESFDVGCTMFRFVATE
jgi:hypothetical protein